MKEAEGHLGLGRLASMAAVAEGVAVHQQPAVAAALPPVVEQRPQEQRLELEPAPVPGLAPVLGLGLVPVLVLVLAPGDFAHHPRPFAQTWGCVVDSQRHRPIEL